jgi:broad specificity phosphatase PhoE
MALEREKSDVLIIAHETVLRCLVGYLFDLDENVSDITLLLKIDNNPS